LEQHKITITISVADGKSVFGGLDENLMKIERAFSVSIVNRNGEVSIVGSQKGAESAKSVFERLVRLAERGEAITEQTVNYLIASYMDDGVSEDDRDEMDKLPDDVVCVTAMGKPIKPKTLGQKRYVEMIKKNTIVFGVGPAGTGKTYLAMAAAVAAFKRNEATRIILTRPAIEAGEKLGFLPGDLQQKVDPYLRPLYDALHEIMGTDNFNKNMEKGAVEVAPLAYMRGRTLDNAFIVLDEAQNTTKEQMKMFLTRVGFGSKVIVTGDVTQIDLPDGKTSGLTEAIKILNNIEGIGVSMLSNKDVVRHPLVQKIVEAYEKSEPKLNREQKRLAVKRAAVRGKINEKR